MRCDTEDQIACEGARRIKGASLMYGIHTPPPAPRDFWVKFGQDLFKKVVEAVVVEVVRANIDIWKQTRLKNLRRQTDLVWREEDDAYKERRDAEKKKRSEEEKKRSEESHHAPTPETPKPHPPAPQPAPASDASKAPRDEESTPTPSPAPVPDARRGEDGAREEDSSKGEDGAPDGSVNYYR